MKAIEKLIQLRKEDPSIVAIAKDRDGKNFGYYSIPFQNSRFGEWEDIENADYPTLFIEETITFDSDNWEECIVTVNDLENYEVKMMSISIQEYERLLEALKKLKEIQKFLV